MDDTKNLPTILVVDDVPANLVAIETVLADFPTRLLLADSANSALEMLLSESQVPAVALLDVQMPEMDGYELAKLLHNAPKTRQMPIVFMSAVYQDLNHITKGYDSGAVDFLVKPINEHILRAKVKVFLELYQYRSQQLKEREMAFRMLFENAIVGIATHEIIFDNLGNPIDYRFISANPAFETHTGLKKNDIIGRRASEILPGIEKSPLIEVYGKVVTSGEPVTLEQYYEPLHKHYILNSYRLDKKSFAVTLFDISERKQAEEQLEHIAHYDALTHLPNRLLLADRLQQAMIQAQRYQHEVAVVYLDLDGFKAVNDTYGHEAGDYLLVQISARMKQALRNSDTLSRLGGDEFVAILPALPDTNVCGPVLERLLNTACQAVLFNEHELRVSASVGVSFYPQTEDIDADQLLRQADQAMYQAKQAGKNRYHIFDAEQDRTVRSRHANLEQIRLAITNNQFVLHYQPKVNMHTGQILGVEALVRWQHPERGLLPPGLFLPIIDNHPLLIELGNWVLRAALNQFEDWHSQGIHIPISINVDGIQLKPIDFIARLRSELASHPNVGPGDLELEVLESSALDDIEQISKVLAICQDMGINVALDDFGTGYSSLSYLKRLPIQLLKIDQSFIRDMLHDPDDMSIIEGVLGLARAFHRNVIAEGVETIEHGEMLLSLGCEWGQGYAIARPMPAQAIPDWIRNWQPPETWKHTQYNFSI